jgi:hypothetical protein
LLFKGGTSLSKAFGLISRFSEDIDITVFRGDLGHAADVEELIALSGKKRRARLDAIRTACQAYIAGPLTAQFAQLAASVIPKARFRLSADPEDRDGQTLLFWYPAVTATGGDYVRSAVKIESGAKSALDPHVVVTVTPYVALSRGAAVMADCFSDRENGPRTRTELVISPTVWAGLAGTVQANWCCKKKGRA